MNQQTIVVGIIIALLVVYLATRKLNAAPLPEREFFMYGAHINAMANKYNVPAKRIAAMILVESALVATAVGSAGERGLMQLKQGALSDVNARFKLGYSFDDLFNDYKNIETGTAYLSILVSMTGNIDAATRAYNVGIGTWKSNPNAGTEYLSRVMKREQETKNYF